MWLQVHGLVGSKGILPIAGFLERLENALGHEAYLRFPTLFWLSSHDLTIHLACAGALALSLLMVSGRSSLATIAALFALYLSLMIAGQTFLSFQWDSLLLETLLWSLFLLPVGLVPRRVVEAENDPRLGLLLIRLLLFKLMFLSGVVKPLSLDETWLSFSALDVHYETQPLPLATSWLAHSLPAWFHRASVAVMYVIEIVVPFALFAPRRWRLGAAALLIALQLLIAATGNYGFFNLLTAVLCLAALDDDAIRSLLRRLHLSHHFTEDTNQGFLKPRWLSPRSAVALVLLLASLAVSVRELQRTLPPSERNLPTRLARALDTAGGLIATPVTPLLELLAPCRCVNGYGLFRAMTTTRPELAIEWSEDGEVWHEYHWRYKPDEPERRPRLAAPHMPRLDWQMWFAALGPDRADWLIPFAKRLLEGEPSVLRLLRDPPQEAPQLVRFVMYDYRFTAPEDPGAGWWRRTRQGEISTELSLEMLR